MDAVAVQGRALLGESEELSPPRIVHTAGRVLREIPDADFPDAPLRRRDDWLLVPFPAGRVGAGRVEDHAPHAVDPGGAGVGVRRFAAAPVGHDREIIVSSVLVPGQIDAPDALPPRLERERSDADAAVASAVKIYEDFLRRGRPQPQMGPVRRIVCTQRPLIAVPAGKILALEHCFPLGRCFRTH